MENLICYDYDDNIINHFTQWDINQTITIKNLSLTTAPIIHFANKNSKEALGVQSTISNGNITAKVPNILLRESLNLQIYIYTQTDNKGKTIIHLSVPVIPKPQPAEYTYTDNVNVIYIDNIANDIKKLETELTTILNDADTVIGNANTSAENAQNIADTLTEKLNNGDFIGKQGEQGIQGNKGDSGFSPTVNIISSDSGNTVTITDTDGEKSFDILNGKDGYSPTISITEIDNGKRITITDNSGEKVFDVYNGSPGEQGLQGVPGVDGEDYILTDADKKDIADLAVDNAAQAANNANAAAQAAQNLIDDVNSKLANGEFNGANYNLTAQDRTEIAQLVTPDVGALQGGTVTYKVPHSHFNIEYLSTAGFYGTIDIAKMTIDTKRFEEDIENGIVAYLNPEDFETEDEYIAAVLNLYSSYIETINYPWSFTPCVGWAELILSEQIPDLNYYNDHRCFISSAFRGYFDIRFENIVSKSNSTNDGEFIKNFSLNDFINQGLYTDKGYTAFLVYTSNETEDGIVEYTIQITFIMQTGNSGNHPALNIGEIGDIALTFTANNSYMEVEDNDEFI